MGLLSDYLQGRRAREAQGAEQKFVREMSNTSYQRGMADMRLAGLNPILAYKQGGASSPGGSMPHFASTGDVMGTAVRGFEAHTKEKTGKKARLLASASTTKATTSSALDLAAADHQTSMAASAREEARLKGAQANKAEIELPWAQVQAEINAGGSAKWAERFRRWTSQVPSLGVMLGRGFGGGRTRVPRTPGKNPASSLNYRKRKR